MKITRNELRKLIMETVLNEQAPGPDKADKPDGAGGKQQTSSSTQNSSSTKVSSWKGYINYGKTNDDRKKREEIRNKWILLVDQADKYRLNRKDKNTPAAYENTYQGFIDWYKYTVENEVNFDRIGRESNKDLSVDDVLALFDILADVENDEKGKTQFKVDSLSVMRMLSKQNISSQAKNN